ncbi:MAG: hypothetical protein QXH47_05950 [Candidatus Bathyarchaeia archaeon]
MFWLRFADHFIVLFPKGGIHVGNGMIDGEVYERGIRIAVKLKSDNDDILRGLGQLLEALAHGYDEALLVTSSIRAERLDIRVFEASGRDKGCLTWKVKGKYNAYAIHTLNDGNVRRI